MTSLSVSLEFNSMFVLVEELSYISKRHDKFADKICLVQVHKL